MNKALCCTLRCEPIHFDRVESYLQKVGPQFVFTIPPHMSRCGKNSECTLSFYHTGKILVQGKANNVAKYRTLLEKILATLPTIQNSSIVDNESVMPQLENRKRRKIEPIVPQQLAEAHIGVDESGKGDYFGALCVAGVMADPEQIRQLIEWGVRDSKTLSDDNIEQLGDKIRALCQHFIVQLDPILYNERYHKEKNLNLLLADLHSQIVSTLHERTGCSNAICDQFSHNEAPLRELVKQRAPKVELEQRFRGEEDVVVAAASILARQSFIRGFHNLNDDLPLGFNQPLVKGCSNPTILTIARSLMEKGGMELLGKYAKLHFRITDQIFSIDKNS